MRLVLIAFATLTVLWPLSGFGAQAERGPRGMSCRAPAAALRAGTFELGVGRTRLRDGRSCVVDRPNGPCEWDVELQSVRRFGARDRFLMASLYANHLTGSGAWQSIFVYECRARILRQVFDASF